MKSVNVHLRIINSVFSCRNSNKLSKRYQSYPKSTLDISRIQSIISVVAIMILEVKLIDISESTLRWKFG